MDQHGRGPRLFAELQDVVEVCDPVAVGQLGRVLLDGGLHRDLQGCHGLSPAAHHVRACGAGGIGQAADLPVALLPEMPDRHAGAERVVRGNPFEAVRRVFHGRAPFGHLTAARAARFAAA